MPLAWQAMQWLGRHESPPDQTGSKLGPLREKIAHLLVQICRLRCRARMLGVMPFQTKNYLKIDYFWWTI